LTDLAMQYIRSKIGELYPRESRWGAKILKGVKNCNTYLVHNLAEHDEIWHDGGHWSVTGLK